MAIKMANVYKQLLWITVLHLSPCFLFTQHPVVAVTVLVLHMKLLRHGVAKNLQTSHS